MSPTTQSAPTHSGSYQSVFESPRRTERLARILRNERTGTIESTTERMNAIYRLVELNLAVSMLGRIPDEGQTNPKFSLGVISLLHQIGENIKYRMSCTLPEFMSADPWSMEDCIADYQEIAGFFGIGELLNQALEIADLQLKIGSDERRERSEGTMTGTDSKDSLLDSLLGSAKGLSERGLVQWRRDGDGCAASIDLRVFESADGPTVGFEGSSSPLSSSVKITSDAARGLHDYVRETHGF